MNILLTGATGFLGRRLTIALNNNPEIILTTTVRRAEELTAIGSVEVSEIDSNTDWSSALKNKKVVIHAAARAHIMKDEVDDPLAEYRRVNVDGTLNLARQAAEAGVKRFIFISTIKVNGEQTNLGEPFKADDKPAPVDAYGISKWEAEKALLQLGSERNLEIVIIRPPLVYGPQVKGNFANIINLIKIGLPLPFGAINNKRSYVALDNLIDLIMLCIDHPKAKNQIFIAGDGQDLSTTELLKLLIEATQKNIILMAVPKPILIMLFYLIRKKAMAQRLFGNLQVDISKTKKVLGWEPSISTEEGMKLYFSKELNKKTK